MPPSSQTVAREMRLQQPAVVTDQHDAGPHARKFAFEPLDAGQIQMIGRLVEQQDVGRGRQHAGERRAARLAAGQRGGVLLAGQTELLQQIAGPVSVFVRVAHQTCLDIGQRGREPGQVRLLRQIADRGAGLGKSAAAIRLHQTRGNPQQRGLARAVAPHEAQPIAGGDRQTGAGKYRRGPEAEADVLQQKQGRRHEG